ncbi:MAG: amidohydrolase family protein, partial [Firmicutes bacterium]|nr:amidohydrolase family protein [Bacillota bacterium]
MQGENDKLNDVSIVIEDGIIESILPSGAGPTDEASFDEVIDAEGKLVTPGLVDGHTHLIFGGYRQHEIAMKLAGADYLDILRAGGGILDTVRKTREATFDELYDKSYAFLDEMLGFGVTCCEAKSGYGLDKDSEIKMLRV